MFERFTDRARRVMALAQEEARSLGHDFIAGTEHLLLGLVKEGDYTAAKALVSGPHSHFTRSAKQETPRGCIH